MGRQREGVGMDAGPHPDEAARAVIAALHASAALERLQRVLYHHTGLIMWSVIRGDAGPIEVHPAVWHSGVPAFCTIVRRTETGQRRCSTCQAAIMSSLWQRPGCQCFVCHGGVHTLAAPAIASSGRPSHVLAVKTCAFCPVELHTSASEPVLDHLASLEIPASDAARAWASLPRLDQGHMALACGLLEVAAFIAGSAAEAADTRAGRKVHHYGVAAAQNGPGLLDELAASLARDSDPPIEHLTESTGSPLIDAIAAAVAKYPDGGATLRNVAQVAGLSPNHLSTMFHAHMGMTFSHYVLQCRIHRAKTLLRDPRVHVCEVAVQCGFKSASHFCRTFKRETGQAPTDWRKMRTRGTA